MSTGAMSKTSRTDWDRLASMTDDEIDYSGIPPLTDDFFERAVLRIPATQAQHWVELDPDVARWFRRQGSEYKRRINKILREHMLAHNS